MLPLQTIVSHFAALVTGRDYAESSALEAVHLPFRLELIVELWEGTRICLSLNSRRIVCNWTTDHPADVCSTGERYIASILINHESCEKVS